MNNSFTEVDCEIVNTTDAAILIEYEDGEIWIPRSAIENGDDIEGGDGFVRIADWFIEKEM